MEALRHLLPEDEAKDKFTGESWPAKLQRLAERQLVALEEEEHKYKDEMTDEQEAFNETVGDLQMVVNNFVQFTDLAKIDMVVAEVKSLEERLRQADKDAQVFNSREALLGLPLTDYTTVKKIIDQFDPFLQFWTTAANWRVGGWAWAGPCVDISTDDAAPVCNALGVVGRLDPRLTRNQCLSCPMLSW